MRNPQEVLSRCATLCEEVMAAERQATKELSGADKAVSEIYHEIEVTRFGVVQGYRLAKRLKEALLQRRMVKMELESLQILEPFARLVLAKHAETVKRLTEREAKQQRYLDRIGPEALQEVAAGLEGSRG